MNQSTAIEALSALGHETRLGAFRLLVQKGNTGLPAGDISETLGILQNTMSTHLNILTNAGLISRVREGRIIRYCANYKEMQSLIQYLLEDCCVGEKSICQPFIKSTSKC